MTAIEFYNTKDGLLGLDVTIEMETVWLSLTQMALLFERDKSVISRHLSKIFVNELDRNSVVAFFATTAKDGKTYQVEYFNLDAILSVGYRVNSRRGIDFRRWASAVLKQHLLDGYSLHEQKLLRKGTKDLEKAILLLSETLKSNALVGNMGEEILKIIQEYAKTWHILLAYDEGKLNLPQSTARQGTQLEYHTVKMAITALKENLMQKYDKFQRKQFSCTPCRVFHL